MCALLYYGWSLSAAEQLNLCGILWSSPQHIIECVRHSVLKPTGQFLPGPPLPPMQFSRPLLQLFGQLPMHKHFRIMVSFTNKSILTDEKLNKVLLTVILIPSFHHHFGRKDRIDLTEIQYFNIGIITLWFRVAGCVPLLGYCVFSQFQGVIIHSRNSSLLNQVELKPHSLFQSILLSSQVLVAGSYWLGTVQSHLPASSL